MDDKIARLRNELEAAEKEAEAATWIEYQEKVRKLLDTLKGKILIRHTSNGVFHMFRVQGYTEEYYGDRSGAFGQWNKARWFTIVTDNYLYFRVADDRKRYFKPEIALSPGDTNEFICLKKGKATISKLILNTDFSGFSMAEKIFTIGKESYESSVPDWHRDIVNFTLFTFILEDESVYKEAMEIALKHVNDVKEFWKKNSNMKVKQIK